MKFILQVHYCCWKDLLLEVTNNSADVELQFLGGSRQHAQSCPKFYRMEKKSRRSLVKIADEIELDI